MITTIKREWRACFVLFFIVLLIATWFAMKSRDKAPIVHYTAVSGATSQQTDTDGVGHLGPAAPSVLVTVDPADLGWGKTVDPTALLGAYYQADGPAKVEQRVWLPADTTNQGTAALLALVSYAQPDDPQRLETAITAITAQASGRLFVASSVGLFAHYRSAGATPKGEVTGSLTSFTPTATGVDIRYTGNARTLSGVAELSRDLTWTGSHLDGAMVDATRPCSMADFPDTANTAALAGPAGASRQVYVNFPSATQVCATADGPVTLTARDSAGKTLGTWTSGTSSAGQDTSFGAWNSLKQNHVVLSTDRQCPVDAQVFAYTVTAPWGAQYTTRIRCAFDIVGPVVAGPG